MGCTQRCECTAREDFVFKVVTKEERRSRRNDISGYGTFDMGEGMET